MSLTDQDKVEIREIARQLVKEVLAEHVASCPHGHALINYRYMLVGVLVGTGLASFAGSTIAISLAKMLL